MGTNTQKTQNFIHILSWMAVWCLGALFFALTVLAATDSATVEQAVDNSCNENGVCEAELGETTTTCSADCQESSANESTAGGGIHPDIIQAGLQRPPIKIEILDVEIVCAKGEVMISWRTNKPTDALLVLNEGTGGIEGNYQDKLYTIDHSAKIKDLDFGKEYYFKIFAKGIYGDDNYDYAELFVMGPFLFSDTQENIEDEEKHIEKKEEEKEYEATKVDDQKLEQKLRQELESKIVPPFLHKKIPQEIANWCSSFKNWVKTRLQTSHIIGEYSLFSFGDEYKWQATILSGIVYFSALLRADNKKRKQRKKK